MIDYNLQPSDFVIHVLDTPTLGSDKIIPGTIWFIPAEFKKVSHYEISDICIERGFAVIIINGDGITLKFPDKRIEKYPKDDELNTILKRIYKDQSLEKYPLAITGNVCIGRQRVKVMKVVSQGDTWAAHTKNVETPSGKAGLMRGQGHVHKHPLQTGKQLDTRHR